jgi:four helix bundle protein
MNRFFSLKGIVLAQLILFTMVNNDLEERLINFAVLVIGIAEKMKKSYAGNDLSTQLIRSSTSSAQNYGEAESAESRKDFIHKMKVVLKELRECHVSLKIVQQSKLYDDENAIQSAVKESNELISIFVISIKTATKNLETEKNTKS